ncbi:MAG: YceI family protein [Gemmatimonadota bacterium]|nr:YceI family protein [Gemmatimonadota bacterium]
MSASESSTATTPAPESRERLAGTWQIDPAHSSVEFAVTHLMISKVRGRFSDVAGSVATDGTPAGSRIDVEIKTASISTHDNARDTHLRSADFFDVEKYPQMRFVSTSIRSGSGKDFHVTGDLTIHGVTRSVEMDVTSGGAGRDPWGNDRAGFSGALSIERSDFGLTWNQALETGGVVVSNTVKVTFDVELTHKV